MTYGTTHGYSPGKPNLDDLVRHLNYATEFLVGDSKVYQTPHNRGWTVTRHDDTLVLIGPNKWVASADRHPEDVMRYFAYLSDALTLAEQDYTARTGLVP